KKMSSIALAKGSVKIPALVGIFFIVSSLFCVIIDDIYAFIALRFFEALGCRRGDRQARVSD
ncbi:multidrug effflux MFS transporter, partial [Klebsiella aerogenes]|uniref:multidrug effflux MFS transporter n=1 Tax=Klebsiella aerogenes TaxID=548 RepID=UPI0013D5947E